MNDCAGNSEQSFSFQNNDDTLRQILTSTKTIALVGASKKPHRPSNEVMEILVKHYGYHVIPINPNHVGESLFGQTIVASIAHAVEQMGGKGTIDMVEIFRNSNVASQVVEEAIRVAEPKFIWLQIGVVVPNKVIEGA